MYFLWVDNAKCGHAPEIWRESHDAPIYGWVSHTPTLKNEKKVERLFQTVVIFDLTQPSILCVKMVRSRADLLLLILHVSKHV